MENQIKSKTRKKKEYKELQALGEQLVTLSKERLNQIDIPEELLEAVIDAKAMSKKEAKRRQFQYIGKLMRKIDPAPIVKTLNTLNQGDLESKLTLKKIETWRKKLKDGNNKLIEEILASCPQADRLKLTTLAKEAQIEAETGKSTKAARILFRYLKKVNESEKMPDNPNNPDSNDDHSH